MTSFQNCGLLLPRMYSSRRSAPLQANQPPRTAYHLIQSTVGQPFHSLLGTRGGTGTMPYGMAATYSPGLSVESAWTPVMPRAGTNVLLCARLASRALSSAASRFDVSSANSSPPSSTRYHSRSP